MSCRKAMLADNQKRQCENAPIIQQGSGYLLISCGDHGAEDQLGRVRSERLSTTSLLFADGV